MWAFIKALDNICDWDHPLRDDGKLRSLLRLKVEQALARPGEFSRHKLCYNAGTAALISDFPPDLVLGLGVFFIYSFIHVFIFPP